MSADRRAVREGIIIARPFDATTKHLIEHYPRDWLVFAGVTPTRTVTVIDADLASIHAEADKVIRVDDPEPWIFHLELQSSYSADLPRRLVQYSVLLSGRHALPVRTLVVLLRPEADGPLMTGVYEARLPDGDCYLQFRYNVVRLWEIPADQLLEVPSGRCPCCRSPR